VPFVSYQITLWRCNGEVNGADTTTVQALRQWRSKGTCAHPYR